MNEMRKLINIMESAMVKEENPKGPPQQGTRKYDQMHQALSELGRLRQDLAGTYKRWPNYNVNQMIGAVDYIKERLQQPLRILDRMEIDQSGREFRVQNQPWSILATGDKDDFQKLINSKEVGPEGILNMFKSMDRDLANLVNKLNSFADARPSIN